MSMPPQDVTVQTVTVLEQLDPESPTYTSPEPDGRGHEMTLDEDVWNDMGRPPFVTVTIQPGDRLNGA